MGFKIALNGLLIVNKQVWDCSIISHQWTKGQEVNKCVKAQLYLFLVKLIACQIRPKLIQGSVKAEVDITSVCPVSVQCIFGMA